MVSSGWWRCHWGQRNPTWPPRQTAQTGSDYAACSARYRSRHSLSERQLFCSERLGREKEKLWQNWTQLLIYWIKYLKKKKKAWILCNLFVSCYHRNNNIWCALQPELISFFLLHLTNQSEDSVPQRNTMVRKRKKKKKSANLGCLRENKAVGCWCRTVPGSLRSSGAAGVLHWGV